MSHPGTIAMDQFAHGQLAFSLSLFERLRATSKDNLVFSPYSVALSLAMMAAGASEVTASQIREVLGLELADDDLHEVLGALTYDLETRGTAPSIRDRLSQNWSAPRSGWPLERPALLIQPAVRRSDRTELRLRFAFY